MAKRERKVIKVCLENRGEDSETPWAEDLGPAPKGPKGSRKVRLVNVPFLHAKPTWGDVIVVSPVEDGLPTWDSNNVPWNKIGTRILEDGGRHAMIVHYVPRARDSAGNAAFKTLSKACSANDIVCEGCYGPGDGEPGCAYLAVPDELDPPDVMTKLAEAKIPAELIQVHPKPKAKPRKAKPKAANKKRRTKK
jgi:hypothetical protein